MADDWLPRNPHEALIKTDAVLADCVPRVTHARERIIDTLPGHSGRPAGNGEPAGGTGASTSTIVERTLGLVGDDNRTHGITLHHCAEADTLVELDDLIDRVVERAETLTRLTWTVASPPIPGSHARRLAWARWLIRQVIKGQGLTNKRLVRNLYVDAARLDKLIDLWAEPRPGGKRTPELAADPTDTLCRSCLRAGHRNQRDPRYKDLCRWCGDFKAEQGQLPSLDIIDAHETGSPIAVARLIRDKKTRKRKRK